MNANELRSMKMKKHWASPLYRFKMRKHLRSIHQVGEKHPSYKKVILTGRIAELYPKYNESFDQHDKSVANEGII